MEKLLIGIAGVFVGALLTILREFFNEWRSKRNDARYLAVRVSCQLDHFISGCFEVVCDNGVEDQQGCLVTNSKTPTIDLDGIDGKWQSMRFDLMYRILDLPNRLNYAKEVISIAAEYGDGAPDYRDAFRARQYQYALLGIEANEIAETLRSKYSMPKKCYETWNPLERFIEKKLRLMQSRIIESVAVNIINFGFLKSSVVKANLTKSDLERKAVFDKTSYLPHVAY